MKLPSNCWMIKDEDAPKISAWMGSTSSRMKMLGTAPMKGPNTGMMLVMPMNTLMSSAKSSRRTVIADKGDDADDGGVDDLADEEPGEVHRWHSGRCAASCSAAFGGAASAWVSGAQLVEQVLLVRQHVDAGRHRSKDIAHEVGRHAAHGGHDLRQGGVSPRL